MATVKSYTMEDVKKGNIILSGHDHFIGSDEKRRNKNILHIEFPYNVGNYAMFYNGSQKILENACYAMETLLNDGDILSESKKSALYKVIIESLHIVHHVSTTTRKSKLNGINSLSTSCRDNCFCIDRIKKADCICSHCYADTQQKTQLALQDRNTINGVILRNIIIPVKYWKKYINPADISKFFRIESFGDVANKTQAVNYINFMLAFPRVHFAVWTKNTGIWYFAMTETCKPENMVYIVSSEKVNVPNTHTEKTFGNVDHIFTVYDKNFIAENNVKINCGGRSCMDCIKKHAGCYYRNTEKNICEELK